jgi:hypothetical protein
MSTTFRRDLERLRYWQGQTLRSRDMRDQGRFDARRRELHNRALHSTDGVAFGLAVKKVDGDPSQVNVECGVAYDCYGRKLLLQQPRTIAIATEPSWLILRYRADGVDRASCCEHPDRGCVADQARLLDRGVELVWVSLGSFEPLNGVALARVAGGDLDLTFRPRQARPLARPRLARGQTVRGNTPWEPWNVDTPDGQGGLTKTVVGVQTHIDTSAAGFTSTPCYLALIDAPNWDVAKAEFAPAFFPHVADPTVDGFTFRLLMVETARRRYAASFGVARVVETTRGVGDGLRVKVDDTAPFQKGDAIALLRPRARLVVGARPGTGDTVTLAAALEEAEVDKTVLAVGNFPRVTRVTNVSPGSATMVADFQATPAIKKGDVLLRTTDHAIAVINSVSSIKKQLTVNNPFANWKATDAVNVARLSKAVKVTSVETNGTELDLTPASHQVNKGLIVVVIDDNGDPIGGALTVAKRTGATIELSPPALTAAEIDVAKVAVLTPDITIQNVQLKSPGITVDVTSTAAFEEGDFVAATTNASAIAAIKKKVSATKLELDTTIPLATGDDLVAANWLGAATVSSVGATGSKTVTIGRTGAVPPQGAFVVRRAPDDSFSAPAVVKGVSGPTLTLDSEIADLIRLDTLAIGAFPAVVSVLSQQAEDEQIQILPTQAGMLLPGDEVALLTAGTTPAPVAQVAAVNGNNIVLASSLGRLTTGQMLGGVHFSDRALLTRVNTPTSIEIDPEIELRDGGDFVGVLRHYADNSNPGLIDRIEAGNVLVLASPSVDTGDGIVDEHWIDGGIVGAAAVAYAPSHPSPQSQFQMFVRLASTEGLDQVRPAVIFGLDLLTGRLVTRPVFPIPFGGGDHVFIWPGDFNAFYRFRPETLSLITTFNTDFPRAFATFAQKQQLSVSWIGCQEEFPRPTGCPGQGPYDVCPDTGSTEA